MRRHELEPRKASGTRFKPATLLLFASICLLASAGSQAQSATLPAVPGDWNQRLEIGPVEGLTTDWHHAPKETGIPLGTLVSLRVRAPWTHTVRWTGAREVERTPTWSRAEVPIAGPGNRLVTVEIEEHDGDEVRETLRLSTVDLGGQAPGIRSVRIVEEELVLDGEDLNLATMRRFFGDSSVAAVRRVAEGHYRTSSQRWFVLEGEAEPASLTPLLEWSVNGRVQEALGGRTRMAIFPPGRHRVTAGAQAALEGPSLEMETYLVRITGTPAGGEVPELQQVTFRAETVPAGFEDDITWMASTKYGSCDPLLGRGPTFTTRFSGTYGPEGRWLGVRADHAGFDLDGKPGDFPFSLAEELKEETREGFIAVADEFSISACRELCPPDEYCCASFACPPGESPCCVSVCDNEYGLAAESLGIACQQDVLTSGMAIGGFDLANLESGRNVGLVYLQVPQLGDAADLSPGYYRLWVEGDASGGFVARFLDQEGAPRAEVPAEVTTLDPSLPAGPFGLCSFSFENGYGPTGHFQVCAVSTCSLFGLQVRLRACLTLRLNFAS